MLGKILLTLAVMAIAYVYVRQRQIAESDTNGARQNETRSKQESDKSGDLASEFRTAAYLALFLMVGLGATLFYLDWQDDHTVLTINLHRDNETQPVSYQVYKYQLQDRAFTTIDGTQITVASSERMEIIGLNE